MKIYVKADTNTIDLNNYIQNGRIVNIDMDFAKYIYEQLPKACSVVPIEIKEYNRLSTGWSFSILFRTVGSTEFGKFTVEKVSDEYKIYICNQDNHKCLNNLGHFTKKFFAFRNLDEAFDNLHTYASRQLYKYCGA